MSCQNSPLKTSRTRVLWPYTSRTRGPIGYCRRTEAMISMGNLGILRAAIQTVFITALLFAAPLARATGEGCTAGAHTFCVTNVSDTTGAGTLRTAINDSNTAG